MTQINSDPRPAALEDEIALAASLPPGLSSPEVATRLTEIAHWIAREVAEPAAGDVDSNARFPAESVSAMKTFGLIKALIPKEYGGLGASVSDVSAAIRVLARTCASSALVLAMHSLEVSNLVRHGTTPALRSFLREVAENELLIANANSEVGLGGATDRSLCALEERGDGLFLQKDALAVSYGEYADALVTKTRRSPDAQETDQAFVICRARDIEIEPIGTWNTMGLRGTCSRGLRLKMHVDPELVFPVPFSVVTNQGGSQLVQIFLSSVWVGLAEAALEKAHGYVRNSARKTIGTVPPAAARLNDMVIEVQHSRNMLTELAARFERLDGTEELETIRFAVDLRNLKVATSRIAVDSAMNALNICGIEGYRRDSPCSLDRVVRDAHGGLIMVSNERYIQANAQLLCLTKEI